MRIVKAKLIKLITDDGLFSLEDGIPLGKEYLVDYDSMHIAQGRNVEKNVDWEKMIICDVFGGWMPIELLEIQGVN
jgi:hypothetical protein